jgi:hypothetical protein
MKTLKELAQEALNVQDACNLSGVVKGFDRAIQELRGHYPNLSTNDFNALPINAMWADKIAALTGVQNMKMVEYSGVYDAVNKLAGIDKG